MSQVGRAINVIVVDMQNHVNNAGPDGRVDVEILQELIDEFKDELGY